MQKHQNSIGDNDLVDSMVSNIVMQKYASLTQGEKIEATTSDELTKMITRMTP